MITFFCTHFPLANCEQLFFLHLRNLVNPWLIAYVDPDEDDTVTLYEVWRDQAALDANMQSDHYRGFQRALGKCTRDVVNNLVQRRVTVTTRLNSLPAVDSLSLWLGSPYAVLAVDCLQRPLTFSSMATPTSWW